jgi:protein-S-isoprenylcysteine O-methyltransferase Ste14
MDALKLKIPPPVVAITMAALMWLIARAVPTLWFALPARRGLTACVALAGVSTALAGVAAFRRARTTVNPLRPERASSLVVSGIYRITRNPMYVGLLLVLVAWALFLSNALAVIMLPAFILYMTHFQIRPEEAALTSAFGPAFTTYKSRVRRWL